MADALTHLSESAKKRVGTTLRRGKYALHALLGVGAMGAVYAATHRNGMRVAIKVLHPEVARVEELRSRFLREGYLANMVQHPGLVRVLDDDIDDDGATFLVMELLEGRTLYAECQASGGSLPVARVVDVAYALLDVLDAVHAAGIVHRDIKPDNVFVVRGAPLKLLDLGIARLLVESRVTASGEIMGTPEYAAPEQALGLVRAINGRTDLYSVGAMMFTLLSGHVVHEARTPMEAMIFGATRPARSLLEVWPTAPPLLANVVDVALSFEQERRWGSALEMRAALSDAMRLSAPPPPHTPARAPGPAPGPGPAPAPASAPIEGTSGTGTLIGAGPRSGGADEAELPVPLVRPARKDE